MVRIPGIGSIMASAEVLFMDVEADKYLNYDLTRSAIGPNGFSKDKMHVYSELGELKGDQHKMTLDFAADNNEVHVVLEENGEILLNGGFGVIELGSKSSYEYAFTNMKMNGYMIVDGKRVDIKDQYAWFDRQYGRKNNRQVASLGKLGESSWMWIGMNCLDGEKGSLSLWDINNPDMRNAFATIVQEDGSHVSRAVDITYDDIWTSEGSGFSYPRKFHIEIPGEDFVADFTCCTQGTSQHFLREPKGLSGCQCLYYVKGCYKGKSLNRINDVEMIGDLCGEI